MPRRILLLVTDLEMGGTPIVVRELAIRLNQTRTAEVEVGCLGGRGAVARQLSDAGIVVTPLMARGPQSVTVLFRLIRLIHRRRYDTVFSFLMHANAAAAVASILLNQVRWLQSIQTTQPYPRWHWIVQRIVHHLADKIVVPSPSTARVAARWAHVDESKIIIIPNAVDPDEYRVSKVPESNPVPYPITFLGRLDPIKDIPTLIRAMSELKGRGHLNIYGEGADRPRIRRLIAELNLEQQVTLHGVTADPSAVLCESGMLVLPSLAEGFGLVLIEAMAAGVPVVATRVAGISDVVADGETGLLVPPGDSSALAAAISLLMDDPVLRHRLVEAGAKIVRKKYSWKAVLVQYQQLLLG